MTVALLSDEAEKMMETVATSLNEKDFEKAVDTLVEILGKNPDYVPAHSIMGAILLSLQQFELAETFLYNGVKLSNWTDYASVVNLATVLRHNGEKELALKTVLKGWQACKIAGSDTKPLTSAFGDCYVELGNYNIAAEWYLSAALAYENDIDMWVKASTLQFPSSEQDNKIAESVLLTGVAKNPNSPELLLSLGLTLYKGNKILEAITLYEQVLRMDSQNNNALVAIATAHHALQQFDAALHYYEIALKRLPDNVALISNCAMLLNSLNRKRDALSFLQRALSLEPSNAVLKQAIHEIGL